MRLASEEIDVIVSNLDPPIGRQKPRLWYWYFLYLFWLINQLDDLILTISTIVKNIGKISSRNKEILLSPSIMNYEANCYLMISLAIVNTRFFYFRIDSKNLSCINFNLNLISKRRDRNFWQEPTKSVHNSLWFKQYLNSEKLITFIINFWWSQSTWQPRNLGQYSDPSLISSKFWQLIVS